MNNEINIPELSLVLLIGVSGSGKSTFAKKHFASYEIVSSDQCRAIVGNDENSLTATDDAFELLHYIIEKRLKNGLLTVVDATNVRQESRRSLIALAKRFHCLPVAVVLDLPEKTCLERNQNRPDRNFGNHVVRQQRSTLKRSLKRLKNEGFKRTIFLSSEEEVNQVGSLKKMFLVHSILLEIYTAA